MITKMSKRKIIIVSAILVFCGCEKEMLLTEFTEYQFQYEPELRIEAILDTENPEQTVVRIDYSIAITDTTIFNGRDDDGDWRPFDDLNDNGKWDESEPLYDDLGEDGMSSVDQEFLDRDVGEGDGLPTIGEPHIDELDEIIGQLHDSTYAVKLYNNTTGNLVADFVWQAIADSMIITDENDDDLKETIRYGGYKIFALHESIDYNTEYSFVISGHSRVIEAAFQPEQPVDFLTHFFTMNNDTLMVTEEDSLAPIWTTGSKPIVYWVKIERIFSADSTEIVSDHPATPISQENGIYRGGDFTTFYFPGLYRWTVYVPSHNYGQYVYSQLPITDSSISNWRDENNNVVLGCAGSMAGRSIYVRIDRELEKLN